jgi:hypothetical protein
MLDSYAEHNPNPDIHWDDPRHATVFFNGRI